MSVSEQYSISRKSIYKKIQNKCITIWKNIKQHNCFQHTVDNIKKCFLSTKTAYYNGFMKDNVTLKTGVMVAENSASLHHRNNLHFKDIKTVKNILQ